MQTPFPGMDPYLEQRGLWERIHTRLIVAMADALNPLVGARYWVDVEQRTYLAVLAPDELVGKPDVLVLEAQGLRPNAVQPSAATEALPLLAELPMPEEIIERFLEVRDITNDEVITVIELLSPVNKTSRDGRTAYLNKRLKVLGSQTNLIEIDLLRAGEPLPLRIAGQRHPPYSIVVSRAWQRPQASVYFFGVRDPIPRIPIPLRRNETEPILDLNHLLHEIYARVGYQRVINYSRPADPALKGKDATWADTLLREHGLRQGGVG